uniref:Uncharacterized protein n=1 Tax=Helianthus annuus TaxID=4232 RepID=A0A251U0J4_HELAN
MEVITVTKPGENPPAHRSPTTSVAVHPHNAKRQRYDRCFSFMEISIDPGIKSLKRLDSRNSSLKSRDGPRQLFDTPDKLVIVSVPAKLAKETPVAS